MEVTEGVSQPGGRRGGGRWLAKRMEAETVMEATHAFTGTP